MVGSDQVDGNAQLLSGGSQASVECPERHAEARRDRQMKCVWGPHSKFGAAQKTARFREITGDNVCDKNGLGYDLFERQAGFRARRVVQMAGALL